MQASKALVLAAVVGLVAAACQDSGMTSLLDPVGERGLSPAAPPDKCDPWPACKDGGGGGAQANFDVEVSGDVSGGPAPAHSSVEGQIVADLFTLDISTIAAAVPNGATCFPDGAYTSVLALTQSSQDADVVELAIVFRAKGTDGSDVKYGLTISGSLGGDAWLPTGTSTIDLAAGSPDWEIGHDSGKGKRVACSGSGELGAGTVTVTALP